MVTSALPEPGRNITLKRGTTYEDKRLGGHVMQVVAYWEQFGIVQLRDLTTELGDDLTVSRAWLLQSMRDPAVGDRLANLGQALVAAGALLLVVFAVVFLAIHTVMWLWGA